MSPRDSRGGVDRSDLIERLKKAAGPDQEIDTDIAILIKAWPARYQMQNDGRTWQRYIAQHDTVEFWFAPEYTASLDAAMTLIPEGWVGVVSSHGAASVESKDKSNLFTAASKTPAIALCTAALKARAALARSATS